MEIPMTPIRKVSIILAKRYLQISKDEKVISMLKIICNEEIYFTDDKLSRWLGFCQGVMWVNGVLSIEEERNFSRNLFHAAYEEMELKIPDTISIREK